MSKSEWERVGVIGVDAGMCWIGDPCYILHADKQPRDIGRSWGEFCDAMSGEDTRQFDYDAGHEGLGVCVSTGYGDGCYPVEVRRDGGRIAEVRIKFI